MSKYGIMLKGIVIGATIVIVASILIDIERKCKSMAVATKPKPTLFEVTKGDSKKFNQAVTENRERQRGEKSLDFSQMKRAGSETNEQI
jgi:uncharacterized membrane protein (DUF106 family)